MSENISKQAVLVLVIIAVVVSVLSTSMVLNSVYQHEAPVVSDSGEEDLGPPLGRVRLTVPQDFTESGRVTLDVVNRE